MAPQRELLVGDAGVQQPTAEGLSGPEDAHLQDPAVSDVERGNQAAVRGLKYGPGTQVLRPAQLLLQVCKTSSDLPRRELLLSADHARSKSLSATTAACSRPAWYALCQGIGLAFATASNSPAWRQWLALHALVKTGFSPSCAALPTHQLLHAKQHLSAFVALSGSRMPVWLPRQMQAQPETR